MTVPLYFIEIWLFDFTLYPLNVVSEAAHADDMPAMRAETLISLAEEFGISQEEFAKAMSSDTAKNALEQDNRICRAAGVHAFPTMKLEYGDKSLVLNGWMPYERFAAAVRQLCGDEIVTENEPMTAESLATFVSQYKKVAAEEIKTAFSLSDSELDNAVDMLLSSGLYQKIERGQLFRSRYGFSCVRQRDRHLPCTAGMSHEVHEKTGAGTENHDGIQTCGACDKSERGQGVQGVRYHARSVRCDGNAVQAGRIAGRSAH